MDTHSVILKHRSIYQNEQQEHIYQAKYSVTTQGYSLSFRDQEDIQTVITKDGDQLRLVRFGPAVSRGQFIPHQTTAIIVDSDFGKVVIEITTMELKFTENRVEWSYCRLDEPENIFAFDCQWEENYE